ncbi:NUDIX domain-containing protein [Candidatus Gottesmanbacteria bacterium]|nr:NUDIX domain-containing protein [Candidatus Gottesmanbacteria bacterium]
MIKRISEKELFKTKIFTIKELELELDTGKKVTRQILDKGDTSLIVPINMHDELIMVKEYFPAIDEYQLGLPKGRVDPGFDPAETANKELQEEICYKALKLEEIGVLTMSPGYITQKTHVFLARDLVESKLPGDEDEELEIVIHPFAKFETLIAQKKITEARMIAALYMARKFLAL